MNIRRLSNAQLEDLAFRARRSGDVARAARMTAVRNERQTAYEARIAARRAAR